MKMKFVMHVEHVKANTSVTWTFLSDRQEAQYFLLKFQNKTISGIGI